jgi:hypothetical protein
MPPAKSLDRQNEFVLSSNWRSDFLALEKLNY